MFKKLYNKIEDIIQNQSTGFAIGFATATAVACAFILNQKEENDPYYTITKREFERAAEEDECLRIRNELGQFRFFMEHPA